MSDIIYINLVYEDDLSCSVLKKIIKETKRPYEIGGLFSGRGSNYIKRNIKGFNYAARGMPYLVLIDLDQNECAPYLIKEWLSIQKHNNLLFRVAVREVESWILADVDSFSSFLGISRMWIPVQVEEIHDPKQILINLARKSRKREIREDIVPQPGSKRKQGRGYNSRLIKYVINYWNIQNALKNSDSLQRTFRALEEFKPV